MITISAYTEPQPVIIVSEPYQTYEPEESAEYGTFAELFAGMLRKDETQEAVNNEESDVPLVDFSGAENALHAGAEILAAEKSLFFTHEDSQISVKISAEKTTSETEIPQTLFSQEELLKTDLFEAELTDEHQNIMLSAEHLLSRSIDTAVSDMNINIDDADILTEFSQADIAAHFTDIKPDANSSAVKINTAESPSVSHNAGAESTTAEYAAAALSGDLSGGQEELLSAEAKSKRDNTAKQYSANGADEIIEARSGGEAAALRKEPGNDGRSRYDDSRNRSRRDKITFDVRDLRTGTDANVSNNVQTRVAGGESARVQAPNEITLELRLPSNQNAAGQSVQQSQTSWEARAGSALENMLARELHYNFNGDIVRHASMALRNGGEGTIRLALKPESLGNVKIQLEMTENKITGIIVVESEEALNAFRREIASLEQAFKDSGYESADLSLSLTADGKSAQERQQEADAFTPKNVASRYDDAFEGDLSRMVDVFFGRGTGAVNMLA